MVYEGQVKNGVVVFESAAPPDGTVVRVLPVEIASQQALPEGAPTSADADALWDEMLKLAGMAQGLPPDMAERHDHYRRERLKR